MASFPAKGSRPSIRTLGEPTKCRRSASSGVSTRSRTGSTPLRPSSSSTSRSHVYVVSHEGQPSKYRSRTSIADATAPPRTPRRPLALLWCYVRPLAEWLRRADEEDAEMTELMRAVPSGTGGPTEEPRLPGPTSPAASTALEWMALATAAWLVAGAYLDAWAHTNRSNLETFFTPWHAVLYSG